MRHYLPTAIALLFVFVFVFTLAATITEDVTAGTTKCAGCCYRPPASGCTALYGQIVGGVCTCNNILCLPSSCKTECRICW